MSTKNLPSLTSFQGTFIFDGTMLSKLNEGSSANLCESIESRLRQSDMKDDIRFLVMQNERYPDLDDGISQAAMDMLITGKTTAVIIFPYSWNSTAKASELDPVKKVWRSILMIASFFSSASLQVIH